MLINSFGHNMSDLVLVPLLLKVQWACIYPSFKISEHHFTSSNVQASPACATSSLQAHARSLRCITGMNIYTLGGV